MPPGSELVWTALAGREPFGIPVSHFQHVVFNKPTWDFLTLDFDKDVELADKLDRDMIGATDPQFEGVFRAWRQVDCVPRMERSTHQLAQLHRLLQQRGGEVGRRGQDRWLVPALYGPRHAPL